MPKSKPRGTGSVTDVAPKRPAKKGRTSQVDMLKKKKAYMKKFKEQGGKIYSGVPKKNKQYKHDPWSGSMHHT